MALLHSQLLTLHDILEFTFHRLLRRADVIDAGDVSDATNRHLDIFYTGQKKKKESDNLLLKFLQLVS